MGIRILAVIGLLLAASSAVSAQTITVAAAANLATVFNTKIVPAFEKEYPVKVVVVIGATKTLEQQMENGAPYDVFVSADTATVNKLVAEGLVDKGSVAPYAIGELVMWSLKSASFHPSVLADLANPAIQHIAVANPKTAPYGAATIESLTRAGLLAAYKPKIVYAENIQQSLQYAATGNADVSFTAFSLALGRTDGVWSLVPDSVHAPIEQAVGVKVGASDYARSFASFLTSREAEVIWLLSGYQLPKQ